MGLRKVAVSGQLGIMKRESRPITAVIRPSLDMIVLVLMSRGTRREDD